MSSIAGICNLERNVFGLMPHPDRACHPILGSTDGRLIFESMTDHLRIRGGRRAAPLDREAVATASTGGDVFGR